MTILLQDGSRVELAEDFPQQNNPQQYKVQDVDGKWYEHVSTAPDGEWIYSR